MWHNLAFASSISRGGETTSGSDEAHPTIGHHLVGQSTGETGLLLSGQRLV